MKLGLFSIGYAGLWGQQSLELPAFIARAAALGYHSVMLAGNRPHLAPLDVTETELHALRTCLSRNNVSCGAVAAYTDFCAPVSAEVPMLEMQFAYLESLCRMAAALGAPLVRVFTGYENPALKPAAAWAGVISCLRECVDRAAAHGVSIAVQNHHDVAVHSDALMELWHDVERPSLRLAFDAWSPALRGEELYETARRMAPLVAMTTNADYVRLPRYAYQPQFVNYQRLLPDMVRAVPFGDGTIGYRAFFDGLVDGGFDGLANYEMCSPLRGGGSLENLDRYATTYVEWMKQYAAGRLAEPGQPEVIEWQPAV